MTALAFLDYIAVLKEWKVTDRRHREIRRVLELVQLGDRGGTKVTKLSGGQRRRLAVAQALIGAPELLVLDEPTTGLDPEQRASLRGLLPGLPATVLISTHQTEDVSALCDRVIVLDTGRVRFDGSVPELLATAVGWVHVGASATRDAVQTWKTGTGLVRSVGGQPAAGSTVVDPSVEDAYLLLRAERHTPEGVTRPGGPRQDQRAEPWRPGRDRPGRRDRCARDRGHGRNGPQVGPGRAGRGHGVSA